MLAERYGLGVSDDEDEDDDSNDDASDSAEANQARENPSDPSEKGSSAPRRVAEPASPWPGVVVPRDVNTFIYVCDAAMEKRSLRTTAVTMYASQLGDGGGRKIAVSNAVVSYIVGGHIRAIERASSASTLLKGHQASVIDTEFLSVREKSLGDHGPHVSVLGSVGEDGLAHIWRLSRANAVFEVSDKLSIPHPLADRDGHYSRIAFRPGSGSIVAANGLGAAVVLLDLNSPIVRVAEIVKMNGETMLRNHFLNPSAEAPGLNATPLGENASACVWQCENVISVARGRSVTFWSFLNAGTYVGRLPRIVETPIHQMIALEPEILLLSVEEGRTIEIWYVGKPDKEIPEPMRLCQTVHLKDHKSKEPYHACLATDPQKDIVIVANSKGKTMIAMHYNKKLKMVDALTEIPTKQPVLSMSITRTQSLSSMNQNLMSGVDVADEILLWCVQPKGIQMFNLKTNDCLPPVSGTGFISTTSTPNKARELDTVLNRLLNPATEASVPAVATNVTGKSTDSDPPVQKLTEEVEATKKPEPISATREAIVKRSSVQTQPEQSQVFTIRTQGAETEESNESPDMLNVSNVDMSKARGDMAQAMLEATKKAIAAFEENAKLRDEQESARVDRMVTSVKENVELNLEQCVNRALKTPMGNSIIPAVSKIVTDMNNSVKATDAERMKVSESLFSTAIAQSNLDKMYQAGCNEILEQIMKAVNKSMDEKCSSLLEPAVKNIGTASKDMSNTVDEFVKQVDSLNLAPPTNCPASEDPRAAVMQLLKEERFNEAFLKVLNKGDLDLVNWLVGQYEPKDLLETPQLSQVAILSLAQQLGMRLGLDGENCMVTVDWLRELMLVLEPEDDMLAESVGETLAQLRNNVVNLQKNRDLLGRHPRLGKQLKTLFLLISSLGDSSASLI